MPRLSKNKQTRIKRSQLNECNIKQVFCVLCRRFRLHAFLMGKCGSLQDGHLTNITDLFLKLEWIIAVCLSVAEILFFLLPLSHPLEKSKEKVWMYSYFRRKPGSQGCYSVWLVGFFHFLEIGVVTMEDILLWQAESERLKKDQTIQKDNGEIQISSSSNHLMSFQRIWIWFPPA